MNHIEKLMEIFVSCEDFYKEFEQFLSSKGLKDPLKKLSSQNCSMAPSEIMAIVIFYHFSGFKCFKYFYRQGILKTWKSYFPKAVSYNRFIELKKEVNVALFFFIHYAGLGIRLARTLSTLPKWPSVIRKLSDHRIHNHKVFKALANREKRQWDGFMGSNFICWSMKKEN